MSTREQEQEQAETAESSDGGATEPLFADDERAGLQSRWKDVQTGFVDQPRQAVAEADKLVSEVVERLSAGFSDARSSLEEQWAKGEDVSTEDLRIALTRYRSFFNRLLSA